MERKDKKSIFIGTKPDYLLIFLIGIIYIIGIITLLSASAPTSLAESRKWLFIFSKTISVFNYRDNACNVHINN